MTFLFGVPILKRCIKRIVMGAAIVVVMLFFERIFSSKAASPALPSLVVAVIILLRIFHAFIMLGLLPLRLPHKVFKPKAITLSLLLFSRVKVILSSIFVLKGCLVVLLASLLFLLATSGAIL